MKKKLLVVLAVILCICCLAGCDVFKNMSEETSETLQKESMSTGEKTTKLKSDAAILVVSFGTSYNDNRDLTIGAIEEAISKAYPEYEVRRAFTSQIIIDILKEREGLEIDNVTEALDRAVQDGIKELYVQSTHVMQGYEYNDLKAELAKYADKFDKIILGEPLLTSGADFDAVIKAITKRTASYDDGKTAICYMGHGTSAESNSVYTIFQEKLKKGGYDNYYIGTVEAAPTLDDVIAALKEKGNYKKVVLAPLMVVAGDHANNDMASEEEDSWKTILEKEGYEVECILEGLGQLEEIQKLYVAHLKSAIDLGAVITGDKELKNGKVTELSNGTYNIEVQSNSSMFKIVKAQLTVDGDKMTAVITLSGTGYGKLYMGTSEKAAVADESDYIPFVEDQNGAYTYTIPVAALDEPLDCAAYSTKKKQWFDRQITFLSETISTGSIEKENNNTAASDKTPAQTNTGKVTDGTYYIDVTLNGGSGKATVSSPATITIKGDTMMAKIEWSSPNYDYMIVNGEKYLPVNTDGNSVFEIPIAKLDEKLNVIADTVAMSKPREIEYTLTFHSDTIREIK